MFGEKKCCKVAETILTRNGAKHMKLYLKV